ncbi:MAG: CPBP family intramembrane metalloprotease [Verrucomicrobiae bacterium]|nr:CPBP family intramembrane metalloprotease [Verrucomicrobiae bacterium]NNJ87707.1 CPBP family intramembrane metalloprotease [Akkermansiaceae bacterium]
MPTTSDTVFIYSYVLSIVMLLCAFPVYGLLRKNAPGLSWHRHGKVSTERLDFPDILGLILFIGIYGVFLKEHLTPPELDENGDRVVVKITPMILAAGYIVQLVPPLLVMVLLVFRQINLVEYFGLRWKKARYLIVMAPAGVITTYLFLFSLEMLGFNAWLTNHFGDQAELQQTVKTYQEASAVTVRIMIAVSVILIAPVAEEVVFRGYIYTATKRFSDRFFAAVFSSLLFGAVHFNIMALAPLIFLALVLAISYELSGSLWAPISIHALFNATTILFQEVKFH